MSQENTVKLSVCYCFLSMCRQKKQYHDDEKQNPEFKGSPFPFYDLKLTNVNLPNCMSFWKMKEEDGFKKLKVDIVSHLLVHALRNENHRRLT